MLQGVLVLIIGAPIILKLNENASRLGWFQLVGFLLWGLDLSGSLGPTRKKLLLKKKLEIMNALAIEDLGDIVSMPITLVRLFYGGGFI